MSDLSGGNLFLAGPGCRPEGCGIMYYVCIGQEHHLIGFNPEEKEIFLIQKLGPCDGVGCKKRKDTLPKMVIEALGGLEVKS